MNIPTSMPRLKGFRLPREVISYAVWAYHRFALSTAEVEDLLAARGVLVSREGFCRKFFLRLRCSVLWTQSSSESGKLLECWDSLLTELPLADHVCGLDPS